VNRDYDVADEDWLDGKNARPRPKASDKKPQDKARVLNSDDGNGTVVELFPNQSSVRLDGDPKAKLCPYRMSTLAARGENRERSPVAVGDRVRVEAGVIVGRCERRNKLIRPAPNARNVLLHVVAANLDLLAIVASTRDPDFTEGVVDRFLVAASAEKIPTALCVNKTDLLEAGAERPWLSYREAGVVVLEICAKTGAGQEALLELLAGKTAAFCGHSGVGKTSLLRRLLGDPGYGRVGEVNAATGKGAHTTTGAVFLDGPRGSRLIDTPGIMNFGLFGIARADLLSHFPELAAAAKNCPSACDHELVPGCRLREMRRYGSWRGLLSGLPGA
jgi:ribosome biogenesis GTPase / thiamine phosphate phosphatase